MKKIGIILNLLMCFKVFAELPAWVNNVGNCDPDKLCVVGSGASLKEAKSDATSEMAKIFEVQIKVNSKIQNESKSSSKQNSNENLVGEFSQWTSKAIDIEANEVLTGVEIKKTFEDKNEVYVLAELNKENVASKFEVLISNLDKENENLYSKKSRFTIPLIMMNLKKRQFYYDRFKVVTGRKLESKIDYDLLSKYLTSLSPVKMNIVSRGGKLPANILVMIEAIFSPLKIILVGGSEKPEYTLKTNLIINDEYFKVEGFKKQNFILKLELNQKNIGTLGRLSASSTQISRSKEAGLTLALEEIEKIVKENLELLLLDKK